MLIDRVHLIVQAGNGGNGCESHFRRTDKKMVPNGGDGGDGGRVIFRADSNAPSLGSLRFKQHLVAESGGHGGSNRKRGKKGKELIVLVPCGTRLYDRTKNLAIRDLVNDGDEVVVLEGGRGGAGNDGGKNVTRGEKGLQLDLELSFRIVADVFLVGLPNSGKSRLLNALTRAHVKEGSYPFATRSPEIGVHRISDYEQLTLCELPSLYRSSHEGRGLGTDFLRHLERAKYVLLVLDPVSDFAESLSEGYDILKKEIETYRAEFLALPHAAVVNKMDLAEARERVKGQNFNPGVPCFYISALTGEGADLLTDFLKEKIHKAAQHA